MVGMEQGQVLPLVRWRWYFNDFQQDLVSQGVAQATRQQTLLHKKVKT